MDRIKYNAGVSKASGSLAGVPESSLVDGFEKISSERPDPWAPEFQPELDDGTNLVGDRYQVRKTGACGRPDGNER